MKRPQRLKEIAYKNPSMWKRGKHKIRGLLANWGQSIAKAMTRSQLVEQRWTTKRNRCIIIFCCAKSKISCHWWRLRAPHSSCTILHTWERRSECLGLWRIEVWITWWSNQSGRLCALIIARECQRKDCSNGRAQWLGWAIKQIQSSCFWNPARVERITAPKNASILFYSQFVIKLWTKKFFMIKFSLSWEWHCTYQEYLHYKSFSFPLFSIDYQTGR